MPLHSCSDGIFNFKSILKHQISQGINFVVI